MNNVCETSDSKLRKALFGGLYLTAFFSSISISISQIGLGIAIISWLIIMVTERRGIFPDTPMTKPIIFYLAALLISAIFGANPLAGLIAVVKTQWIILIFFLTLTFVQDLKTLKRLLYTMLAGGAVASIYGIAQYIMNGLDLIRPIGEKLIQYSYTQHPPQVVAIGFFRHHLTYAEVLLFNIFLCLSILFWRWFSLRGRRAEEGRVEVGTYFMLFILIETALFFSLTRSSWLAFLGTLILMAIFLKEWSLKFLSILTFIFFVTIIVSYPSFRNRAVSPKKLIPHVEKELIPSGHGFTLPLSDKLPFPVKKLILFYNRGVLSITSSPRFYIWQSGLKVFAENPITGVGSKNWGESVKPYREEYSRRYERNYNIQAHAHNNLIQQAATGGIIGLVTFLYIWIVLFVEGFKIYKRIPTTEYFMKGILLGGLSGITAFHVAGLFECTYNDSEVAMLLWFVTGFIFVAARIGKEKFISNG